MTIGEKIRELRRVNGITQERLAEALNVSPQAVSKWERGASLPDITMIAPLANCFGVTADALFGLDGISREEELSRMERESARLAKQGRYDEQYRLWEEAARKYPLNCRCLTYYSRMLHRAAADKALSPDERTAAGRRAVEIAEWVAQSSDDSFCKYSSIQLLVLEYADGSKPYHDEKKAAAYANSAASFWVCREVLMAHALSGEKRAAQNKSNVKMLMLKIRDIISKLEKSDAEEEIRGCEAAINELKKRLGAAE